MTERGISGPIQSSAGEVNRTCCLNEDVVIEGNVSSTGNLDFGGTIIGDLSANQLNLLQTACVRGNIRAERLTVAGQFFGTATASALIIASTARVEADLTCRDLSIEAGARCHGKIQRIADHR